MRKEVSLDLATAHAVFIVIEADCQVRKSPETSVVLRLAVCRTLGTSSTRGVCYKDNKHQQHDTTFTSGRRRMHLNNRTVKQRY